MMRLVITIGLLMKVDMRNRWPFMCASDIETARNPMRRVLKALADAPYWLIIEMQWNIAMHQNKIWYIAFEVRTTETAKEVC
jgi:hypothetical protein